MMISPGFVGKKWAAATVDAVGPVRARVPSGAMVAGKGDGMMVGVAKRGAWAEGPPVRWRVKAACSGTQMSLQTSQKAVAWMFGPVWVAVKGRMGSPERT